MPVAISEDPDPNGRLLLLGVSGPRREGSILISQLGVATLPGPGITDNSIALEDKTIGIEDQG